mgnify:CR=1 FL=1
MGQRDQIQLKRADGESAIEGNLVQFNLITEFGFAQFALEDFHGERCCIDRAADTLPQIRHGT